MIRIRSSWNGADKVIVAIQIIVLALCATFTIYVTWFSAYKMTPLVKKKKKDLENWHEMNKAAKPSSNPN